jgi:hypothetical protein
MMEVESYRALEASHQQQVLQQKEVQKPAELIATRQ